MILFRAQLPASNIKNSCALNNHPLHLTQKYGYNIIVALFNDVLNNAHLQVHVAFAHHVKTKKYEIKFYCFVENVYKQGLQKPCHPPPETKTPSELTAIQFTIELCPIRFWRKFPSGNFHCLMLSGDADAKANLQSKKIGYLILYKLCHCLTLIVIVFKPCSVIITVTVIDLTDRWTDDWLTSTTYCVGCKTTDLTLFLWLVSVTLVLPAAKSHRRIVQSWLPVITCKA